MSKHPRHRAGDDVATAVTAPDAGETSTAGAQAHTDNVAVVNGLFEGTATAPLSYPGSDAPGTLGDLVHPQPVDPPVEPEPQRGRRAADYSENVFRG